MPEPKAAPAASRRRIEEWMPIAALGEECSRERRYMPEHPLDLLPLRFEQREDGLRQCVEDDDVADEFTDADAVHETCAPS